MVLLTIGNAREPDHIEIRVAELDDAYRLIDWIAMRSEHIEVTIESSHQTL